MRPAPGLPAPSGVGEREGASSGGLSSGGLSSGMGEREGAASGVLSAAPPRTRSPPQALLRPSCFAAQRPLSCPPLFSSYPLSFLDSLGCYQPGWRLRHHKAFPPDSELSSPRPHPALLLERWVDGVPGVHY